MKRAILLLIGLCVVAGTLSGCGDTPSTPLAPDQPKPPPGPPPNMDQMMRGTRGRDSKH